MKTRLPVRKAILARRAYEPPGEGRARKVRLDFNENTAGCSPAVLRALAKLTAKELATYPEYARTTRRLARHFGIAPEELLLTNGGDEALRLMFDTFVDAGSNVVICEPAFPMYRYWGEIHGAKILAVRYGRGMVFPLEGVMRALAQNPRVVFVCNPNNPTGTLARREEIEKILNAARRTAVVVDEAYAEFAGVTVMPWIRRYPQLFVVRSFSKTAGLAGLRLGALAACRESMALVRRAAGPFSVNVAALAAAEAAVADGRTTRRYVSNVMRLRGWLEDKLNRMGVRTYPSAANFVLADFGERGPGLFRRLERRGILVRDRSKEAGPGHARITIGTGAEMRTLVKEIQRER